MRVHIVLSLTSFLCCSASVVYPEPTLQSIIDAIQTNAEKRADLLKHSSGACTVRLQYEAGEDRPVEKIPFSIANFQFDPNHTAQVTWMQRVDDLRFDVLIPIPVVPPTVWSPFAPRNTRTTLDGKSSMVYDVSGNSVIIDKQPPAAINPTAILHRFEPNLLYRFRGHALYERLSKLLERGWTPTINESQQDDQRLLKLLYTWKRGDNDRDREGSTYYILAPHQGYSLVEGVYRNRIFHNGEFSTETFERYDATYAESPEHPGVWLLSHLRHLTDNSGTLDAIEISFEETRVGIDIPDVNFTAEGLGIKDGSPTGDRRAPTNDTAADNP